MRGGGGMLVGNPLLCCTPRPHLIQEDAMRAPMSCTPSMLCAGLRADGGQLSSAPPPSSQLPSPSLCPRNTLILLLFSASPPPYLFRYRLWV